MATISGGDALEAALKEIAKRLESAHELEVGYLEGSTYPNDEHLPVGQAAAWLNYGTKTSPPRPYFTNMVKKESPKWGDKLARALRSTNYDAAKALGFMGEDIGGALYEALISLDSPPLSPVTLMLRKMRIGDKDKPVTWAMVKEARARVAAGESTGPASTKVGVYSSELLKATAYSVDDGEHVFVAPG